MTLRKVLLVGAATVAFVLFGAVLTVGSVYAAGGVATVAVHESDSDLDLYLPLPALLVDLVLTVAERPLEDAIAEALEASPVAARQALPAIERACEELHAMPEGVLVDVRDGGERVRLSKVGSRLELVVDNADIDLRIAVPAATLERVARRLL